MYAIVQYLNIPLQSQPRLFLLLALITSGDDLRTTTNIVPLKKRATGYYCALVSKELRPGSSLEFGYPLYRTIGDS